MNVMVYNELSHDPYEVFCSSNITTEGNTVLLTCLPGNTLEPEPASSLSGFESISCLFVNHGVAYFGGKFLWR